MRKFVFLWFLAFGLVGVIGAVWVGRSIRFAVWNSYESDLVRYTAQTAASTLTSGGIPALEGIEREIDPEGRLRVFVYDAGMRSLSGGPGPEPVRAFASSLRPQEHTRFEIVRRGVLAGSMIETPDRRFCRVIVFFPQIRVANIPVFWWGWIGRIAAIAAAAGLLCSWLAWRLSTPLLRLRHAARRFASGDLKVRANESTFPATPPEYRELARDFDDMAGRIETLVDSQRQLLRDVSHELRTPLTRLNLAVNNARHVSGTLLGESLDRIDQESERLNALIDRIIRLSRVEASAEPPRQEVIELGDFIESIVSDADFEAAARHRRVSMVHAEMCRLTGDRELLREAIENIVRNSIRYTPENTAVTVDAYRYAPAEYRIAVRDCGPGVPPEHMESIFEPFFRASQDSPGFGIGLAIVKRAISLHHGTVTARNLPEGGLEVTIALPVTGADKSLQSGDKPGRP